MKAKRNSPIIIEELRALTPNWFSITFGKNAANPATSNPSLAPAIFKKKNVGLTIKARKAFGISFSFVNTVVVSVWACASDSLSIWYFSASGNTGGKASNGNAIINDINAEIINPNHQAPTQPLFLDIKSKLKFFFIIQENFTRIIYKNNKSAPIQRKFNLNL